MDARDVTCPILSKPCAGPVEIVNSRSAGPPCPPRLPQSLQQESRVPESASDTQPEHWTVRTSISPSEALAAFAERARRGKLAEYRNGPLGSKGGDFSVEAAAAPFDHKLVGSFESAEQATLIRLRLHRHGWMPLIFAVILIVAVWPGVWLTDSMLVTYFGWYSSWVRSMPWLTYAWYLPLTAGPLPWMWKGFIRKSRAEAHESAAEMAAAIAQAVNGTVEPA